MASPVVLNEHVSLDLNGITSGFRRAATAAILAVAHRAGRYMSAEAKRRMPSRISRSRKGA
jgi:hypothetical protein